MKLLRVAVVGVAIALAGLGFGQTTKRAIDAVRVSKPPVIDGNLDDLCWTQAPSSSGFSDETLGTLVSDDTTVWIAYDDRHIYVAFSCRDAQPAGIVGKETKRGRAFGAKIEWAC